jgi:hypothetical protein
MGMGMGMEVGYAIQGGCSWHTHTHTHWSALLTCAKSGCVSSRVFARRLRSSLSLSSTVTRFTARSLMKPTCPGAMLPSFLRLEARV